jgi:hypothetical protein
MPSNSTDEYYREAAKEICQDGWIEIDGDAPVSRNDGDDNGAYVQAWIWIDDPQEEECGACTCSSASTEASTPDAPTTSSAA